MHQVKTLKYQHSCVINTSLLGRLILMLDFLLEVGKRESGKWGCFCQRGFPLLLPHALFLQRGEPPRATRSTFQEKGKRKVGVFLPEGVSPLTPNFSRKGKR